MTFCFLDFQAAAPPESSPWQLQPLVGVCDRPALRSRDLTALGSLCIEPRHSDVAHDRSGPAGILLLGIQPSSARPRHRRLRAARLQGARDPTRTAACPRRARDLPAAAHARPRRGPTGLRGRARQRAPQRLGESGVRVLSLGGTCAPAWRFSSCYSVAI